MLKRSRMPPPLPPILKPCRTQIKHTKPRVKRQISVILKHFFKLDGLFLSCFYAVLFWIFQTKSRLFRFCSFLQQRVWNVNFSSSIQKHNKENLQQVFVYTIFSHSKTSLLQKTAPRKKLFKCDESREGIPFRLKHIP